MPTGWDVRYEDVILLPVAVDDRQFLNLDTQRWCHHGHRDSAQVVDLLDGAADALHSPLAEPDGDPAAFGIGHADDRLGEVLGVDADRLALEPLVLGRARQALPTCVDRELQEGVDIIAAHGLTLTLLE